MKKSHKLLLLIDEGEKLARNNTTYKTPAFELWRTKTERFLYNYFGKDSFEIHAFKATTFEPFEITNDTSVDELVKECRKGLKKVLRELGEYYDEISDEEFEQEEKESSPINKGTPIKDSSINERHQYSTARKYQVFISSTYVDLKEERAAVTQCLLDMGLIPVGMEQFPASGMSQMDYIKKMLADCDYYILILAGRYGSFDSDGIGFTEKEYDYAKSVGLPVMSFLADNIGSLPSNKCEETDEKRKRLYAFRDKVRSGSLVRFYKNKDDLKAAVATSMQICVKDFPAKGWVRFEEGEQTVSDDLLSKRIEEYIKKRFPVYNGEVIIKKKGAQEDVDVSQNPDGTLVIS